ncbi:hypothetical protein Q8F55_000584 [Vanrija albida]|uniref:PH domain-containing protein n=1 Tax=Vanrija albida TaxID=181172 RepID=A0ABR3QDU9_9TREE
MPQNVVNSEGTLRRRKRMHDVRRKAMGKLLGTTAEDELLGIDEGVHEPGVPGRRRKAVHRFKVRYRDLTDNLQEQDVDVNESDSPSDTSSEDEEERGGFLWGGGKQKSPKPKDKKGKKKKKLHKDVWIGGSFDIGREFKTVSGAGAPDSGVTNDTGPGTAEPDRPTLEEAVDDPRGAEKMAAAQLGDWSSKLQAVTGDDGPSSPGTPKPTTLFGPPLAEASSSRRPSRGSTLLSQSQDTSVRSGQSSGVETFVTAHSHTDHMGDDASDTSSFIAHVPPDPSGPRPQPSPPQPSQGGLRTTSEVSLLHNTASQASSSHALVAASGTQDEHGRRASKLATSLSDGSKRLRSAIRKGSAAPDSTAAAKHTLGRINTKTVQFPADPATIFTPSEGVFRQGDEAPADPVSVLTRPPTHGTSADAQQDLLIDTDDFMPGGIVMRDRVLVKVGRHLADRLGPFDEAQQRRNPCYRFDDMEEYVLAMTMTSVDFYQDWRFKCQERMKGHKRLVYSIPLSRPTTLSVFNPRDMTLCLTCDWATIVRQTARNNDRGTRRSTAVWDRIRHSVAADVVGIERHGSAVLIVKFGERSRALDWNWYLMGQLDYKLPPQIDIRIPALRTSVRVPIPEENATNVINRDTIISGAWELILADNEATEILKELKKVPRPELAWKNHDATLDWIAYPTSVTGKRREWAVLASFAESGKHGNLQVRDASHHAVRVKLEDGTQIDEPPGVEGYLIRHASDVARKEAVYVSTNDGVVFVASPKHAKPPLHPKKEGSTPADIFPEVLKTFLAVEHRRVAQFIEGCAGAIDLRDIESIEMLEPAAQDAPPLSPVSPVSPVSPMSPTTGLSLRRTRTEHVKRTVVKKAGKKKEREFKVTLVSGAHIRFEAHTPSDAEEWVERLSALVDYWKHRHRVDARQRMDAVQRFGGNKLSFRNDLDFDAQQELDDVWNWCVIEGCRAITNSGRIFIKQSAYKKFKSFFVCLTSGCLVLFRMHGSAGLRPRQMVYPLFGAYVYSGLLAHDELTDAVHEAAFNPSARIYGDGLQTTDGVEDCSFAVRITWPTAKHKHKAAAQPWDEAGDNDNDNGNDSGKKSAGSSFIPPALTHKPPQLLLFRARCKLERDRWVWAINAEMERQARQHLREEEVLRNHGNLPRRSTLQHALSNRSARSGRSGIITYS